MLIAAEVFVPLRLFACPASLWYRTSPHLALVVAVRPPVWVFKKFRLEETVWRRACKKGLALSLYGTSGSSYILETREVLRLLHREFVYVGDPVPELNEQEHAAFLMNIQKSILLSLEKRKLLTHSQRERCLVELEKQYSREPKSRRRA